MARRIRFLLSLVVLSFVLTAAACADATGPQPAKCDTSNSNTAC